MLTKEQLNILSVFHKNIFISLTFKQIKEQSKQKSNNIVQIALKEFKKQKLIISTIIGDVTVYSLNIENNLTLGYLNMINQELLLKQKFPKETLIAIQKKLLYHTEFFILIIFGSYAKHNATNKSDLDIAIIVDSEQIVKDVTPSIETIKRREILQIDYHIFTRNNYLEMLSSNVENLGKQIYKNNMLYFGYIEYINLILRVKK
jgi:predicted nucleotidyltransferase